MSPTGWADVARVSEPLWTVLGSLLCSKGGVMPNERIAMRHVREVLRLKSAGVPIREVARRVGTAPSTVCLTLKRAASAGVFWPVEEDLSDRELEQLLFVQTSDRTGHRRLVEPDWSLIHCELKRNKHLTLQV